MADPRVVNLRDYRRATRFVLFDLPPDVVKIDRRTRWGNPYEISRELTRAKAIDLFRSFARRQLRMEPGWLEPLQGKRLACWCAPLACHGEVLLEILDVGVDAWLAAA